VEKINAKKQPKGRAENEVVRTIVEGVLQPAGDKESERSKGRRIEPSERLRSVFLGKKREKDMRRPSFRTRGGTGEPAKNKIRFTKWGTVQGNISGWGKKKIVKSDYASDG